MKRKHLSVKKLCLLVGAGAVISMLAITAIFYTLTKDALILMEGGLLTSCALIWMLLLISFFSRRLSLFTNDLCKTLDAMINGDKEPKRADDGETLLDRISHRLSRLYGIMQENRRKVDEERQELQMLISDISHQVKTPVSNLKMVTDTLLTKPVTEQERVDFLQGIRSQTYKLDFLFQALVKTSRLETGAIRLERKDGLLELYLKLNVTDTGKGIAESNQAAVFRRFYREEEVHDKPGVGIGLYLAREIITRQGGYIKVASEIGKGSTFSVFLSKK